MSLPVCQVSLPRLANSFGSIRQWTFEGYVVEIFEFASLPRFLSRGMGRGEDGSGPLWNVFEQSGANRDTGPRGRSYEAHRSETGQSTAWRIRGRSAT